MNGPGGTPRRGPHWRLLASSEGAHRLMSAWASTWGSGSALWSDLGAAPTAPTRKFGSTEHLSTEAVAAYVDSELPSTAFLRASAHLAACAECTAAVAAQQQARAALRRSGEIRIPPGLLNTLRSIPNSVPAPAPEPGGNVPAPAPEVGKASRRRQQ